MSKYKHKTVRAKGIFEARQLVIAFKLHGWEYEKLALQDDNSVILFFKKKIPWWTRLLGLINSKQ